MALAVAFSERMTGNVAIYLTEDESDEWDLVTDAPMMREIPIHVYVVDSSGALWDINGRSSHIAVGEGERVTGGFSPISTVEQTWKAREAWLL